MIQRTYDELLVSDSNKFKEMLVNGIMEEISKGNKITVVSTNVSESMDTYEKEKKIIEEICSAFPNARDYIEHVCEWYER